jgi:Holliday junction resolvase-like predicted endonuclease
MIESISSFDAGIGTSELTDFSGPHDYHPISFHVTGDIGNDTFYTLILTTNDELSASFCMPPNVIAFVKELEKAAGRTLSKGELGEEATRWLIKKKGFRALDKTDGFLKTSATQEGIDVIYKDGDVFVLVESKFTSKAGNVGKGMLDTIKKDDKIIRQMSDDWIDDAIVRMKEKNLITSGLASQLEQARATGKIRKEFAVIQNVPLDGKTVVETLKEVGIYNVDLIKLGKVI